MSAVLTHSPAAFNSQVRCRKLVFCLPKTFSCGIFCSQRRYTTRIALVQINFKQLLILSVALPNTHFFRKTALKGRLWYCGHFRPSHFSTTLYKTDDSILHKAGTQNTTSPQQSNNLASLPSFSSDSAFTRHKDIFPHTATFPISAILSISCLASFTMSVPSSP